MSEMYQKKGNNFKYVNIPSSDSYCYLPIATIIWSMATTIPAGFLLCNGNAVGRSTYPELFNAIGITFGAGNGSTTFNLPNLIGKFIEGSTTAGIEHEAGLPNIEGDVNKFGASRNDTSPLGPYSDVTGAFESKALGTSGYMTSASGNQYNQFGLSFDASLSNSIYGNSNTVQPASVTALPCIKAFYASDSTITINNLITNINNVNTDLQNTKSSTLKLNGTNLSNASFKVITDTWRSGYNWYRKYSDGWIEQGGDTINTTNNNITTLNIPFTNTNYSVFRSFNETKNYGNSFDTGYLTAINKTTTQFTNPYNRQIGTGLHTHWFACGD